MSLEITEYGIFGNPSKIVVSPVTGNVIIMGENVIYSLDPSTGTKTDIQGATGYEFKDIDASWQGELLELMESLGNTEHIVKIIGNDMFKVKKVIQTSGQIPQKGVFASTGNVIFVAGPDVSDSTEATSYFYRVNFETNVIEIESRTTLGKVIGAFYDERVDLVFSVTSGGQVWTTPGTITSESSAGSSSSDSSDIPGTILLATLGYSVSTIGGALSKFSAATSTQEKVRVFVGSSPWTNDRWDSGEVSTVSTEMVYGGEDNLSPGQQYYVHIMTYHPNSGWSRPQIKPFSVPKE